MPTYVYQEILENGDRGDVFEVVQRMADDALTTHPTTGRPVRRVLQPPGLPLKHGEAASKVDLGDKNLSRLGFTKYQKTDQGQYEKTAGVGPDLIQHKTTGD
jgi:hypothetical protein